VTKSGSADRNARLARALRENLKRRKARHRAALASRGSTGIDAAFGESEKPIAPDANHGSDPVAPRD